MQLVPHSKKAWYTSWPHSHLKWITNEHKQFKRCGSTRELSNIPQHAWLNIQVSWFLGGEHTTSSSCTWWLSGSGALPGSKRRRPESIQQGNLLRWQVNKIIYKLSHLTSCAITYGQTCVFVRWVVLKILYNIVRTHLFILHINQPAYFMEKETCNIP